MDFSTITRDVLYFTAATPPSAADEVGISYGFDNKCRCDVEPSNSWAEPCNECFWYLFVVFTIIWNCRMASEIIINNHM